MKPAKYIFLTIALFAAFGFGSAHAAEITYTWNHVDTVHGGYGWLGTTYTGTGLASGTTYTFSCPTINNPQPGWGTDFTSLWDGTVGNPVTSLGAGNYSVTMVEDNPGALAMLGHPQGTGLETNMECTNDLVFSGGGGGGGGAPAAGLAITVSTSTAPTLLANVSAALGDPGMEKVIGLAAGVFIAFYVMRKLIELIPRKEK
jgi:hypothetical protein